MHSVLAAWRLSLRRTRADWPIVAAAWLITLLATVLFAAGPIYSSAAALAGVAPNARRCVTAGCDSPGLAYATPAELAGKDGEVQADLHERPCAIAHADDPRRTRSATLALPAEVARQPNDRAAIGFLDGLTDHAHLVQGSWPAAGGASDVLQVVVLDAVAAELNLTPGDEMTLLLSSATGPAPVPVQLVGTFAVNDPGDPYWFGDVQLTTGIVDSGTDRLLGPFLTTPEGILGNPVLTSVHLLWRAFPNFDGLTVDNIGSIRSRLGSLIGGLDEPIGDRPIVTSGLPTMLETAERSLLVSRTEMLLLMAQLAIMAAYAIVLTASVLVDHRRVETALLRSRGVSAVSIALLALAEGLLLVVPAVVVAPWLAVAEAGLLNVAGPLADIGLTIRPAVTADSYLLAVAAGLLCLVLLVLPAFLAARNFASEERELSRQETRGFAQRLGLDVDAAGRFSHRPVAAVAVRRAADADGPGQPGFDPLLVAAPALGLLAGGILALRILPLLALALEAALSRGREVVASLGSRQLARRPLRYTRTALLLILALSMGVFALSYAATWSPRSRIRRHTRPALTFAPWLGRRLGASRRCRAHTRLSTASSQHARRANHRRTGADGARFDEELLALDPDAAPAIVKLRSDESTQPLDELMRPLREGRPEPQLVALPADPAYLRVVPLLDISTIVDQLPGDAAEQGGGSTPIDPATLTGVSLTATAIVRDAHGLLYRVTSEPVSPGESAVISLPPAAPLELAALGVDVLNLPSGSITTRARVGVADVGVAPAAEGPWAALPNAEWSAKLAPGAQPLQPVASSNTDGLVVLVDGTANSFLAGGMASGRVFFVASQVAAMDAPVPVIANAAFLAASRTAPGDSVAATINGTRKRLSITGAVNSFPTTDPGRPLLVVDEATLGLLRLQATNSLRNVDEWWLAVTPGKSDAIAAALRAGPFQSGDVVSVSDRTRGLTTDPVALAIIGALLLGFVATGVFAMVALVASAAVSARQRRTEFALLRALGLSAGQLSRWLWLENGSVVIVSLIAGTAVGVLVSTIALPFITVTQQAMTPVPGVLVHLPWDRIIVLDIVVVVALGIAVGLLAAVLRRIGVGSILRLGED